MRKLLVVLVAAACVVGFTTSSMAAIDENFALDGRVGFFTSWNSKDSDYTGGDSRTDLVWKEASGRVRVRYNTDKIGGYFEIEQGGLDLFWAEYKANAFIFRFGLDDPISFNPVGSPPGPNGNLPIGQALGGGTGPIARLLFPVGDIFTLTVAGVAPSTTYATSVGATDTEIMLPALEVKADFLTGGIPWALWGGYQTMDARGGSGATAFDETISSYQVGGVIRPSFGPIAINFSIFYDINRYLQGGPPWHSAPNISGTPTTDVELMGVAGSITWKINPKFSLTGGAGYNDWSNDANDEDTVLGYYINLPITVTPGFMILPYITVLDLDSYKIGTSEVQEGSQTEVGAYWQITF